MNLDYGGVLSRAWKITWNNKILWLFGILSGLAGSGRVRFDYRSPFPSNFPQGVPASGDFEQFLRSVFGRDVDQNLIIAILVGLACVGIVVGIVLFVLGVIGRGGLIGGIQRAERDGRVSFGDGWKIGVQKFWTVLLIGLVVAIVSFVIGVMSVFAAATICLLPLACIGGLIIAVLGVYTLLAQIAAVTENLGVTDALSRAWQVLQANLGPVIILGLILVVINSVIGALLLLPLAAIAAPAIAAAVAFSNNSQAAGYGAAAISALCLVVFIPLMIILGGILQTWVTSAWTLAYSQFSSRPSTAPVPAAPPAPSM